MTRSKLNTQQNPDRRGAQVLRRRDKLYPTTPPPLLQEKTRVQTQRQEVTGKVEEGLQMKTGRLCESL